MNQHGTGGDVMQCPLAGLKGGPKEGQEADEEDAQDQLTDHDYEAEDDRGSGPSTKRTGSSPATGTAPR